MGKRWLVEETDEFREIGTGSAWIGHDTKGYYNYDQNKSYNFRIIRITELPDNREIIARDEEGYYCLISGFSEQSLPPLEEESW
jgi:hypothetical protein